MFLAITQVGCSEVHRRCAESRGDSHWCRHIPHLPEATGIEGVLAQRTQHRDEDLQQEHGPHQEVHILLQLSHLHIPFYSNYFSSEITIAMLIDVLMHACLSTYSLTFIFTVLRINRASTDRIQHVKKYYFFKVVNQQSHWPEACKILLLLHRLAL